MKKSIKIQRVVLLATIAILAFMVSACANNETAAHKTSANEPGIVAETSGLIPYMSLEEMTAKSELVIVGRVVDKKDFKIDPVGDLPIVEATDYYVEPVETLRGTANNNPLTVRITGNYVFDEINVTATSSSDLLTLEVGEEYLLILTQYDLGGDYNTEGDYYSVQNCGTGAYQKAANDADSYVRVLTELNIATTDDQRDNTTENDTKLNYASYVQQIEKINQESPVDPSQHKKEYLSNLKENLKNGFLSQAGYEEIIKNLDKYATIIE
ncbi:MAG: hypothetical protein ACOX05_05835 [Bacillota bacterium]|jgi:hypothetical protein